MSEIPVDVTMENAGSLPDTKKQRVDISLDSTPLPSMFLSDYMFGSASAENTNNLYQPNMSKEGVNKLDNALLRYQDAIGSIRGNKVIKTKPRPFRLERVSQMKEMEMHRISEDHFQNVQAESEAGLRSIDSSVRVANSAPDRKRGDNLFGRDSGLERFQNDAYMSGPPTAVPFTIQPNIATTDSERINDMLVKPVAAFVKTM